MAVLFFIVLFLLLVLCVLLSVVISVQESKSMGLGSSFGGDVSNSLFGTSTAGVLRRFTGYLTALFMLTCFILSLWSPLIGRGGDSRTPELRREGDDTGKHFYGSEG
ncbi:MAG: preprotein translocase subunit SecG [Simkaniaceae bacterium]|nr:preprotein translocase subunit SecG [Simkaniaceae bacterium]